MHLELSAPTAADTRAVGAAIAGLLRPGDGVALTGELGAGKTTFVQGVASALRYEGMVGSPTFTLVRQYRAEPFTIVHADVYRLDKVQDVLDLGLREMVEEGAVLLVEWGDAVEAILPPDHLVVELRSTGTDEERSIALRGVGRGWVERWTPLEDAVQPWRVR